MSHQTHYNCGIELLIHSKVSAVHRWNLGMDKLLHPTLYWTCDYLSMLGLRVIHVGKTRRPLRPWKGPDKTRNAKFINPHDVFIAPERFRAFRRLRKRASFPRRDFDPEQNLDGEIGLVTPSAYCLHCRVDILGHPANLQFFRIFRCVFNVHINRQSVLYSCRIEAFDAIYYGITADSVWPGWHCLQIIHHLSTTSWCEAWV